MALKWLRDNLKSLAWILWLVIAAFVALIFFDWGGVNRIQDSRNEIAATVGGEAVTYKEFQQEYRNLESRYQQALGEQYNRELGRQLNLPLQALNRVVDRKILLMEARKVGVRISDEEVRKAILEQPFFLDDKGQFVGAEEYERIVRRGLRLSLEEFEDSIREQLLLERLNSVLMETTFVSDEEVERAFRDQSERAKIRYVKLASSELSGEVSAEPAELESYFADNQDLYQLPEQRIVDYLLVDRAKLRQEIDIPEEELRAYYDSHNDEFTRDEQVRARHILIKVTPERSAEQAESQLADIRRRVEAGEDFAALAREVSEDEGSASRGGNLGSFGRGQMVKPFEEAAFNAQVGELVGPVKSDFGFHLIEVQDHQQSGLQPFDQVQARVRARLLGERVEQLAESKIKDVATRVDPAASKEQLQQLADEEGLSLETTEAFSRDDVVPGIGRAGDFSRLAFELEEVGAISEPVRLPRGWAILKLQEVIEPRLPELAEVRDQVQRAVEQEKQKEAALARLNEVRPQVAEKGFEGVAEELGLEPQESNEFGRQDSISGLGTDRQVIEAALELESGALGEPVEVADGAVLFEVIERKKFDPEAFAEAKETTRRSQESERLNELLASIVEVRRRDLAPDYDGQLLEAFDIPVPTQG